MKKGKKLLCALLSAVMLWGVIACAPFAADAQTESLMSQNVLVSLVPNDDTAADPDSTVSYTLVVEGLGTDLWNNQISYVDFSVSDGSVLSDSVSLSLPSAYTPDGGSEPTGLQYSVSVPTVSAGISYLTATVTDVEGREYTGTATVTVRGIRVSPGNIVLEINEACVLFAERYGFTSSEMSQNLIWSKDPNDSWITLGAHGANRQKEAYYIQGMSVGTGVVNVSLREGGTVVYSDTVSVTVVPRKGVIIMQDGTEVTEPVNLSGAGNSTELEAVLTGFPGATAVTWESSDPGLVCVSEYSDTGATITRLGDSETSVAVTATATSGDSVLTYTVIIINDPVSSLRITGNGIEAVTEYSGKYLTIKEGETVTLSALSSQGDATATVWSATTESGRVPVKLSGTVGRNIEITGRLATEREAPVIITATDGEHSDSVYVTVVKSVGKSVRITGGNLGADGVMVMAPGDISSLSAELTGFDENTPVSFTWQASVAKNNENPSGNAICPVSIMQSGDNTATVLAGESPSTDFALIIVSALIGGVRYTDEVYAKVTGCDIIDADYVTIFRNDVITLQTTNGREADWQSTSQKVYVGNPNTHPTAANPNSVNANTCMTAVTSNGSITNNPVKITATQNGLTDSVYINVTAGSRQTVAFDLNGGYGTVPDSVVISSGDTSRTILLPTPDAAYNRNDGEYEFYGWSEYADAGCPDKTREIYFPGELYSLTSGNVAIKLYAVWAKKTEDAMFVIKLSGNIPAGSVSVPADPFSKSTVYIRDALRPAGCYYNTDGVESHLAKVPSDSDIARVLGLEGISYNPENDRIIWYAVRRIADDAAGLPNWHVDGQLVKDGKVSLTYNKNTPVANVNNMPDPPCAFYDWDSTAYVTTAVPSFNGGNFIGWNSRPDGDGDWYLGQLVDDDPTLLNGGRTVPAGKSVNTDIRLAKNETLYAIWDSSAAFFSHSLILSGEIGVVFNVYLPDSFNLTDTYMTYDIGKSGTARQAAEDAVYDSETGLYKFTCYVGAYRMADTIMPHLHYSLYGEEKTLTGEPYSAEEYFLYVKYHQDQFDSNTVNIVRTLADYGHYSQIYLGRIHSFSVGDGEEDKYAEVSRYETGVYDYDAIRAENDLQGRNIQKEFDDEKVSKITYNLDLESQTNLYLNIYVKDGVVPDAATLEDGTVLPLAKRSKNVYRVSINGIKASKLGDNFTVTVSAGGESIATVTVSPMSYISTVLNAESGSLTQPDIRDTVCALYYYYKAVSAV